MIINYLSLAISYVLPAKHIISYAWKVFWSRSWNFPLLDNSEKYLFGKWIWAKFGNDEPWEQLKILTKKALIIQLPFTECSEIPILLANLCLHICIWSLSNQWTDTFSTSNINSWGLSNIAGSYFKALFSTSYTISWFCEHIFFNLPGAEKGIQ